LGKIQKTSGIKVFDSHCHVNEKNTGSSAFNKVVR